MLQASYQVAEVVLTGRQECCRCSLAGANIYVGTPAGLNLLSTDNPEFSTDLDWQLCATVSLLPPAAVTAALTQPLYAAVLLLLSHTALLLQRLWELQWLVMTLATAVACQLVA